MNIPFFGSKRTPKEQTEVRPRVQTYEATICLSDRTDNFSGVISVAVKDGFLVFEKIDGSPFAYAPQQVKSWKLTHSSVEELPEEWVSPYPMGPNPYRNVPIKFSGF